MAITNFIEGAWDIYKNNFKMPTGVGNVLSDVILYAEEKQTYFTIKDAKISVKKSNDLKSTSLISHKGSVKELIQAKDYEVKISGTLIGEPDALPFATLAKLNKVLNESESILVASTYLATFEIFRLAFKETTFDQGTTVNTLPFTLVFESDNTYEFDLSGKEVKKQLRLIK